MIDPEAPAWLTNLVAHTWDERDWQAWREVWKPELAKRGITPEMLYAVGDPGRPLAVEARHPKLPWCSGEIQWNEDVGRAVLLAFGQLVQALDDAARGTGQRDRVRR